MEFQTTMNRAGTLRALATLLLCIYTILFLWRDGPVVQEEISIFTLQSSTKTTNSTGDSKGAEYCLSHRGAHGQWVQDWDYAHRSHYQNYDTYARYQVAIKNFHPTPSQPYRLATSYKWVDEDCPVSEVNARDFCQACSDLGIDQILVMGDSMSIEFSTALQALLGIPPLPAFEPIVIECPGSMAEYNLTLWMTRLEEATDWLELIEKEVGEFQKTHQFIGGSEHKTAIVANLGAWMESTTEYELGFGWFLEWLESLDESKIVPFWRPTIPGHFGCLPEGEIDHRGIYDWSNPVEETPYANYSEYSQTTEILLRERNATQKPLYRWHLFEGWNDWSYQLLYNQSVSLNDTDTNGSLGKNIHWLNIFPSAVLRRDGHIGYDDCLHYYFPGPVDWWAHFFHSALLDLASLEVSAKETETADFHA